MEKGRMELERNTYRDREEEEEKICNERKM
jgi:hypothetical protein